MDTAPRFHASLQTGNLDDLVGGMTVHMPAALRSLATYRAEAATAHHMAAGMGDLHVDLASANATPPLFADSERHTAVGRDKLSGAHAAATLASLLTSPARGSVLEVGASEGKTPDRAALPPLPALGGVPLSRETLMLLVERCLELWRTALGETVADPSMEGVHAPAHAGLEHLATSRPVIASTTLDYLLHHCGVA